MTRVTPPITKINQAIRSFSTTTARPGNFSEQSRHVNIYLPRKLSELRAECNMRHLRTAGTKLDLVDRLTTHDVTSARDYHPTTLTRHRPLPRTPKPAPLMQGFQSSAPKHATHDTSTIDYCFFPFIPSTPLNPYAKLRVPLLPDNYHPDRSANSPHAAEPEFVGVPRPEVHVVDVSGGPEIVIPAAGGDHHGPELDLGSMTAGFAGPSGSASSSASSAKAASSNKSSEGGGLLKELWSGIKGDIFGGRGGGGPKANL